MTVHAFGLTDPGKVRSSNEDHFLVADLSRIQQTSHPQQGQVLLVADGMGGANAGEVASALSVAEFLRHIANLKTTDEQGVLRDLREAVQEADARIIEEAKEHRELKGMGTTLTIAFISGQRLFILHAGDSRCYLWRAGQFKQLTEDHTLVAELVSHGTISSEEARESPYRHMVTNVLGGDKPGVRVDVLRVALQTGDRLLLCSDGLTDMLEDKKIAAILAEEAEPEKACRRLVEEANTAGGKDNITAVVARFGAA
jgi:protein phosphatase